MHFTIRQLEAFAVASELQSFTKTASHLHLTPSAVSQLIVELEAALGYRLFDRSTRKMVLSPAGQDFLPAVKVILRDLAAARTTAIDIRDQSAGAVRVAAPLVVASVILPPLVARYRRDHPNVAVRVIDCPVDELVARVASRAADLAVGPDCPVASDVRRVPLFPSPWVAWCAPQHRLARRKAVTWEELHMSDLVAASRDHEIHLARITASLPEDKRFVPVQVVDNVTTALGLAAANLCYTLTPAYISPLAQSMGLTMKRVENPVVMREMSLFRPTERSLSPAATGFSELVVEALREASPEG